MFAAAIPEKQETDRVIPNGKYFNNDGVSKPYVSKMQFMTREHDIFDILRVLVDAPRRVIACATELVQYFKNWTKWKQNTQRTLWIYKPLQEIEADLRAYSSRTIRWAIELLMGLLILERRHDPGHKLNRTYQYKLNLEYLKAPLQPTEEAETRMVVDLTNCNNAFDQEQNAFDQEQNAFASGDQIKQSNSIENSRKIEVIPLSQSEREEKQFNKEEQAQDLFQVNSNEVETPPHEGEKEQLTQKQPHPDKDKYSAPPVITKQRVDNAKRNNEALQGFNSQEERDGFYQSLLELGKHKSGVRSPAGWANQIIKSVNVGEPCEYLNEYRRGDVVGMCDKQEWEAKPGMPHSNFVSYLKRKFEAKQMTSEQATEATFKALRDVNEARTLWEGYKRHLANLKDEWESQQALGVSNAYIPAEMLPEREVTIEEAVEAIQTLACNSVQVSELAAAPVYELAPAPVTLPEAPELAAPETSADRNQAVKALFEQMREHLKSGNVLKVSLARMWVRNNLDVVEPLLDDRGQIVDFFEKSDEGFLLEEPHPIPGCESKDVGASQLANDDFWADESASVGKNVSSKPKPKPKPKNTELDMGAIVCEVMNAPTFKPAAGRASVVYRFTGRTIYGNVRVNGKPGVVQIFEGNDVVETDETHSSSEQMAYVKPVGEPGDSWDGGILVKREDLEEVF